MSRLWLFMIRRRRRLILGLALLMLLSFYGSFVLSCIVCVWRTISFSVTEGMRHVLSSTETFDLVEYKHETWTNKAMVELIVGNTPSRSFLANTHMADHLSGVKPRVFDYIINNESLCKTSGEISFVLSVLTSPKHFEDRMILRSTYGRENVFLRWAKFFVKFPNNKKLKVRPMLGLIQNKWLFHS